jgi:hypothetical protein
MPPERIIVRLLYHVGHILGQLIHELLYGLRALHYHMELVRRVVVHQGMQESLLQPLDHCLQGPTWRLKHSTFR